MKTEDTGKKLQDLQLSKIQLKEIEAKDDSIDDLKYQLHEAKEELRRANTVIDTLVRYSKHPYEMPW